MSRRRRPQVEIALDDLQQALVEERREVFRTVNQLATEAKREATVPAKTAATTTTASATTQTGKQKKATSSKPTDTAAKLKEATERYELLNDMLKTIYELDIKYRS